ncbi:MAG: ferric reductase-like transmembrane domain-containing protein [Bdellovibrionaceae bacterium]|nr:ferric reductase-like transmembrane domain-containing protein [Pseudobdellovibrionaceae bacterium]
MTKSTLIRWVFRLAIWIWVLYWILGIFWLDLGASPALKLNHEMGQITLVLLTVNLLLGILIDLWRPLPTWLRFAIQERRFWGISSFLVLVLHVFFYFLNEGFEPKAWTQVFTKTYLILGALAFAILFVMAVTSNNWAVKKLRGPRWKRLQRIVYAAQVLILLHVISIEKADLIKYSIWIGGLCALQAARWIVVWNRRRV